jgi:hypothetical protein
MLVDQPTVLHRRHGKDRGVAHDDVVTAEIVVEAVGINRLPNLFRG